MKKIGLLSDTHSFLDQKIFHHFTDCDEIWHAGDIGNLDVAEQLSNFKPLRAVYGNIDGADLRAQFPHDQHFVCEGMKVWITHIGGYPPKYNSQVKKALAVNPPDIFICGHSHILRVMSDPKLNNMLYVNPGAAGQSGFHHIRTVIRFEIADGKVGNMQVVELGKRA